MNIAVVQTVTPQIASYTKYTLGVNAHYCLEKGYEYHLVQNKLGNERHPSWNRINAVKRFLLEYDWIIVVDADAIIQNSQIRFESIIEEAGNAHILVCDDQPNGGLINCGVMVFKGRSHIVEGILTQWWHYGAYVKKEWEFPYEQAVFRMFLEDPKIMGINLLKENLVKIYNINAFNSHWMYIPEDNFIAHIMARSDNERVKVLSAIHSRIFNQENK